MRINKFVAQASGLSRRAADQAITGQRVQINDTAAHTGAQVTAGDKITMDGEQLQLPAETTTIMLNKPAGYVCSRDGQGSATIYSLLPAKYRNLKPAGRLDKDSSGLLLLTNDGNLANQLTHPRYGKTKVYEIVLDKPLQNTDKTHIETGVRLDDGPSRLALEALDDGNRYWQVVMSEGRNRQIRRTFEQLGYTVTGLRRTAVGDHQLGSIKEGAWEVTDI